jgi:hypothetical protein
MFDCRHCGFRMKAFLVLGHSFHSLILVVLEALRVQLIF